MPKGYENEIKTYAKNIAEEGSKDEKNHEKHDFFRCESTVRVIESWCQKGAKVEHKSMQTRDKTCQKGPRAVDTRTQRPEESKTNARPQPKGPNGTQMAPKNIKIWCRNATKMESKPMPKT